MQDSKITIRIAPELRDEIAQKVKSEMGLTLSAFTKLMYRSFLDNPSSFVFGFQSQKPVVRKERIEKKIEVNTVQQNDILKILNKKIF